jgi:hypothetical protein
MPELLDKLDDAAAHAVPFAKLHLGRVSPVVLLDEADRVQQDERVVGDVDHLVWCAKVLNVALSRERREVSARAP